MAGPRLIVNLRTGAEIPVKVYFAQIFAANFVHFALLTSPELAHCTKNLCIFVHTARAVCVIIKTVKGKEVINMLKVYKMEWKLNLDGSEEWHDSGKKFLEEEHGEEITTLKGKDFQSFWDLFEHFGLMIPANRWNQGFFSKKRRIEFFWDYAKTWVDNGEEREWTLKVRFVETKCTMEELMKMDSELVIQYLKERGINKI